MLESREKPFPKLYDSPKEGSRNSVLLVSFCVFETESTLFMAMCSIVFILENTNPPRAWAKYFNLSLDKKINLY